MISSERAVRRMIKRKLLVIFTGMLGLALIVVLLKTAMADEIPRITKEELKAMLAGPDVVIVDVRLDSDLEASELKIKGSVKVGQDLASWADSYSKNKTIVLYCACLKEATSAFIANRLLNMGFSKVYVLKGGWQEWLEAKFPTELK